MATTAVSLASYRGETSPGGGVAWLRRGRLELRGPSMAPDFIRLSPEYVRRGYLTQYSGGVPTAPDGHEGVRFPRDEDPGPEMGRRSRIGPATVLNGMHPIVRHQSDGAWRCQRVIWHGGRPDRLEVQAIPLSSPRVRRRAGRWVRSSTYVRINASSRPTI